VISLDRRSFVKTCVGVAGVGALAASGLSIAAGTAKPRAAAGNLIRYYGAHRVGGPAPRGVPLIPIQVGSSGAFEGKISLPYYDPKAGAVDPSKNINVLDWYKYCGHAGAPGLKPDFTKDNTLTYFIAEEKLKSITPWFKDLIGQPIRPEDFPAFNFGASFVWRSAGQSGTSLMTGVIVKVPPEGKFLGPDYVAAGAKAPAIPLSSRKEYEWVRRNIHWQANLKPGDDATNADLAGPSFIALSTYCTHFCCTPGYREAEGLARTHDAWDNMYCTCHNSNYNFREPVAFMFAPDTGEAGGTSFDPVLKATGGK
jgi:Rieske Fe-S protein